MIWSKTVENHFLPEIDVIHLVIMQNKEEYKLCYNLAKELFDRGKSWKEIEEDLSKYGAEETLIFGIIKELKEDHFLKKRKRGFAIILVGSVILLLSFILTCMNFHANESITYVMFGISSVGLIVVFIGLFDIFG